jgi:hypothetical protein
MKQMPQPCTYVAELSLPKNNRRQATSTMPEVQTTERVSAVEATPGPFRDKELPPTPSQRIRDLELEKKSLQEENRALKIQVDVQAHQIANLNRIFGEGVNSYSAEEMQEG